MKKFFRFLAFLIGISIIFLFSTFIYFKNKYEKKLKADELNLFITEIKKSKSLPESFYKIYEEINPKGTKNDILTATTQNTKCQSHNVARRVFMIVKQKPLTRTESITFEYFLTREIEKSTSQKQCLNWIAQNSDFLYGAKGIENASKFYFKKNLENLNENEMEILVKMLDNPVKNNPLRKNYFC